MISFANLRSIIALARFSTDKPPTLLTSATVREISEAVEPVGLLDSTSESLNG